MGFIRKNRVELCLILAALPLAAMHLTQLAASDKYQFAIVFLPLTFGMAIVRLNREGFRTRPPSVANLLLRLGSSAYLLAGFLIFSPWFVVVGLWLATGSLALRLSSESGRTLLFPWLTSIVTIPPPFGIDQSIVLALQSIAAMLSAEMLDFMQIVHLREGNTFEIAGESLLVEEACSGVNSLYTTIALSILIVQMWNLGWVHLGLLAIYGVAVDIIANAVRIFLIVLARSRFDLDLLAEPNHARLGIVVFLGVVVLLGSFSKFLDAFLLPFVEALFESELKPNEKRSGLLKRLALGRRRRRSKRNSTAESADSSLPTPDSTADRAGVAQSRPAWSTAVGALGWFVVPSLAFAGLQVASIYAFLTQTSGTVWTDRIDVARRLEDLDEREFDSITSGLGLLKFETVNRKSSDINGEFSRVWHFGLGDSGYTISCDYPFISWHTLDVCYRNTGWEVEAIEPHSDGEDHWLRMRMSKRDGAKAIVFYSLLNSDGGAPIEPPSVGERALLRFLRDYRRHPLWRPESAGSVDGMTTVQIQMFVQGDDWPNDLRTALLEEEFLRYARQLRTRFD